MIQHKRESKSQSPAEYVISASMCILLVFVLFIGLFLAYFSTRYSYYSPTRYDDPFYIIKDNELWNLLTFGVAVALALILNRLFDKLGQKQRVAGYIFLGISCVLYIATCLYWTNTMPYYPSGDQLNTTAAAYYHLEGNFIMLTKGGYLGKYPHQKGLTLLYEILFSTFGDFCYPVAANFHIGMGVITLILGYLFVEETTNHNICKILYCPLFLFCIPYIIMTPYAYGDLPSVCFCTVLFWALLRFARTNKWRYVLLGCISASLALMVRSNTWIVLIAMIIGMLLVTIQKKKMPPVLAGILIMASAAGTIEAIDYSYYLRSGYTSDQGAPMIMWVAMGLQDSPKGPGTYNNYQTITLGEVDYDTEAAAEVSKENIKENLSKYVDDPAYGYWFFKTKLLLQWIEPTFEAMYSTASFDDTVELPPIIQDIYFGNMHDQVIRFCDRYQSIIYFGFLCFIPAFFKKRKENPAIHIPLIAIVGGFLFSLIWEAKSRYMLPYYMFMLVYIPDGIWMASMWVKTIFAKCQLKFCPKHDKLSSN